MDEDERWTDRDSAELELEGLPDDHASRFVDIFTTGLSRLDEDGALTILRSAFVTPESVEVWGDFTDAREAIRGRKVSMTPLHPEDGSQDVAYVRIVKTDEWISRIVDEPDAIHVTLVKRPDLEQYISGTTWRIHALGEPKDPADVPRAL